MEVEEDVVEITAQTPVEKLLDAIPEANEYLIEQGLPCIVCGEPFWGTLGDLARRHGVEDVDALVRGLNALTQGGGAT